MVPLGTIIAGIGTALWGVQVTSAVMAASLVLLALVVGRLVPATRELD
jgi:hypothetical protein